MGSLWGMLTSTTYAGVAELADALASGASELRLVKVQVLSPAPLSCAHSVECAFLLTLRSDTAPHLAPCFRLGVGQTQLGLKAGQSAGTVSLLADPYLTSHFSIVLLFVRANLGEAQEA